MKINLDAPVRQLDGSPFKQAGPPMADGQPTVIDWNCTLKDVVMGALVAQLADDRNLSIDDKVRIYRLAQQLHPLRGTHDFKLDDVKAWKDRCNKMYPGPQLFGVISDLLEGTQEVALVEELLADPARAPTTRK